MAIVEFRGGPMTHRYLMNKTKDEIASEAMRLHRLVTKLQRDLIEYGGHTSNCSYRTGHDCDCGLDEARKAAREWLE